MFGHWDRPPSRPAGDTRADGESLVAEAAAFLNGDAPAVLARHRRPVPAWAWLNPLAHRPAPAIVAMARAFEHEEPVSGTWVWCAAMIAHDLAHVGREDPPAIERLQAEGLRPLELDLLGRAYVRVTSPAHLLALASARIRVCSRPRDE